MGPLARLVAEPSDEEAPGEAPQAGALALLEAIDRDGMVRQAWRIAHWPVSIGRALDNDIVLTDPHVAAHHAWIDMPASTDAAPSSIVVSAGETRNGLTVARERVPGGATTTLLDSGRDLDLQVGRTALRLRLPGHVLAPEQALAPMVARDLGWLPTAGLALAVLAVVLFNTYIDSDPDGLARASGGAVLTAVCGGAIWCGLWALLSKTFTRKSHFGWHVRVFVIASLVMLALSALPPLVAFSLSWPWVSDFNFVAVYATIAGAVYFHLLAVEPGRQRLMRAVSVTGFVVGVALSLWFNVQRTGRLGEELYMSHLFPPQLRLARPVSVDRFVDGMAPMQAILDKRAKDQSGSDADSSAKDDDEE